MPPRPRGGDHRQQRRQGRDPRHPVEHAEVSRQPVDLFHPSQPAVDHVVARQARQACDLHPGGLQARPRRRVQADRRHTGRSIRLDDRAHGVENPPRLQEDADRPPAERPAAHDLPHRAVDAACGKLDAAGTQEPHQVQRVLPHQRGGGVQRRRRRVRLEPALSAHAVVHQRQQQRMAEHRQPIAQRRARPHVSRRGLDEQADRCVDCQIDNLAPFLVHEEAIRDHGHMPPRHCKKTTGRIPVEIRATPDPRTPKVAESSYTISGECCGFSPPVNHTGARSW